ncbi:type III secretion system chaperone [Ramlibacter sp. AW1]|uniref:Type III secretion system chaperone n=1 Tax=Ramlibacter aurantiacus TaxID=2801330 RepID=A0A936ZCM3_9BURK|nr:type III secretion system chaperone [Ramlibacter aurantiacus]MBL0419154.1 type III secretion system chaperone [Ramlibacter aurantiacus]
MNIPEPIRHLIRHLGRHLGIRKLQPGPDGVVAVLVGDQVRLHILPKPIEREFLLFAVVGTLAPEPPLEQLACLLRANRFWRATGGATLSLDDEDPPRVVMAQRVSWHLAEAEFIDQVEEFVGWVSQWRKDLQKEGWKSADAQAPSPAPGAIYG